MHQIQLDGKWWSCNSCFERVLFMHIYRYWDIISMFRYWEGKALGKLLMEWFEMKPSFMSNGVFTGIAETRVTSLWREPQIFMVLLIVLRFWRSLQVLIFFVITKPRVYEELLEGRMSSLFNCCLTNWCKNVNSSLLKGHCITQMGSPVIHSRQTARYSTSALRTGGSFGLRVFGYLLI